MKLINGVTIPEIGLGVFKMAAGDEMNQAIHCAYQVGYRLFDTAQMYQNEEAIGQAIQINRIDRKDVFLISKVDNCNQGYVRTLESFQESLDKLQVDYLDSFLVHWPGQNKERMTDTWKAMETLYETGKACSIGVCNFEIVQLEYLMKHCKIAPMINQIEHTPLMHDEKLIAYCQKHGIQVMAWGPLLRGNLEDDRICQIATRYGKSPAQILLRWNIQQGIIPIPKSKNSKRLLENISVFDFELSKEDIDQLNRMNENHRTSHDPLTFDF